MRSGSIHAKPRWAKVAALLLAGPFMYGLIESCDDRLVAISRFVDPCGTFLANCAPGDFEVRAADVGDFCVDPACTVPGQCPGQGQPLGTIVNICP